jgi:hypothetical protein
MVGCGSYDIQHHIDSPWHYDTSVLPTDYLRLKRTRLSVIQLRGVVETLAFERQKTIRLAYAMGTPSLLSRPNVRVR